MRQRHRALRHLELVQRRQRVGQADVEAQVLGGRQRQRERRARSPHKGPLAPLAIQQRVLVHVVCRRMY